MIHFSATEVIVTVKHEDFFHLESQSDSHSQLLPEVKHWLETVVGPRANMSCDQENEWRSRIWDLRDPITHAFFFKSEKMARRFVLVWT